MYLCSAWSFSSTYVAFTSEQGIRTSIWGSFTQVIYRERLQRSQRKLPRWTKCARNDTGVFSWFVLSMSRRGCNWILLRRWLTNTIFKNTPVERENMLFTVCNLFFKQFNLWDQILRLVKYTWVKVSMKLIIY